MICLACRRQHHEDCKGGTWCDCQHRPTSATAKVTVEPTVNWVRQG